MEENKIVARVCKHAFLSFNQYDSNSDLLTAKITDIYADGTRKSRLAKIENYKRDFYIVKPKHRNFKDKKDYIELSKCDKYSSNEAT